MQSAADLASNFLNSVGQELQGSSETQSYGLDAPGNFIYIVNSLHFFFFSFFFQKIASDHYLFVISYNTNIRKISGPNYKNTIYIYNTNKHHIYIYTYINLYH